MKEIESRRRVCIVQNVNTIWLWLFLKRCRDEIHTESHHNLRTSLRRKKYGDIQMGADISFKSVYFCTVVQVPQGATRYLPALIQIQHQTYTSSIKNENKQLRSTNIWPITTALKCLGIIIIIVPESVLMFCFVCMVTPKPRVLNLNKNDLTNHKNYDRSAVSGHGERSWRFRLLRSALVFRPLLLTERLTQLWNPPALHPVV